MCFAPQRRACFSASQLPKMVRTWCALYILTSKGASRHNGVHFFDIATSKSAPDLVCFVRFDFEMCFAPQRRAFFRYRNFQKCSEPVSFLHFWLRNVLRATTACTCSSLIWPAGSAPAALASLLFDPPEPQIIGKTQCFATFLPFRAPRSSFFWDFLFFDLLSSSLLFSNSSHLCFSFVHIVGSLTSKLPSNRSMAKWERNKMIRVKNQWDHRVVLELPAPSFCFNNSLKVASTSGGCPEEPMANHTKGCFSDVARSRSCKTWNSGLHDILYVTECNRYPEM